MVMAVAFGVWALLVFGVRTAVAVRRTGDSGMRGITSPPGSAGWWGGVLFAASIVLAVVALGLAAGEVAAIEMPQRDRVAVVGWSLVVAGTLATLAAQLHMGSSWRVGVDPSEHTELVTGGAFAIVRNPIFTAMIVTAAGFVLLVPNVASVAALVTLVAGIQLQVRAVEEPYLLATHPAAYRQYASQVGRFVPGIGRLDPR